MPKHEHTPPTDLWKKPTRFFYVKGKQIVPPAAQHRLFSSFNSWRGDDGTDTKWKPLKWQLLTVLPHKFFSKKELRFQVSNSVNVLATHKTDHGERRCWDVAPRWKSCSDRFGRGETFRKRRSFFRSSDSSVISPLLFSPAVITSTLPPLLPPLPPSIVSRLSRLGRPASHSRQRQNSVGMNTPNATRMGNIRLLLSAAYGFGVRGPDWTLDLEPAGTFFFPPSSPPSLSSSSSSSSSCFSKPGWGWSFGTSVKWRRREVKSNHTGGNLKSVFVVSGLTF